MDGMIELSVDRPRVVEPFEFTGSGVEYFRIWIVNLALSIATLGIYSAWAKVRRTQYFYRHTHVAGARFQYLGRPGAILKGRIVAAILFGTYTAAGQLSPFYGLAAFGVLALVMPWLLARSFRFRLSNTSYRGIRFGFAGSTAGSYGVFLGLPLLTVLTLFVLGPFTHHRIKKYQIGQARFGQTSIAFLSRVSEFYIAYVAAGFL
ncbi:MAG TPA: YjgN family protein, partial [Vicinamibacterales bacterium]